MKNPVEKIASNPVTSVAVMFFFGPDFMYGSKMWKCHFSVASHLGTQLARQPPQSSSKGNLFVWVRFGGFPNTVEEVVWVQFCCSLDWTTNMGSTGGTVVGHRPISQGRLLARTDFSRIFIFKPPAFFGGFCRRIFLLICRKKCPEKSPRKIPNKIP